MSTKNRTWIVFLIGAGLTLIAAGLSPLLVIAQDSTAEATPDTNVVVAPTDAAPAVSATEDANLPNTELTGVTPEPVYHITSPRPVTGDDSYCLVCHNQPWHTTTLQDGSIQNLYVNPATVAASVHGDSMEGGGLGCVDCHGNDVFPHDQPSPTDSRTFRIQSVQICASCHADEAQQLESGLHEQAIRSGDLEAAVCIDCHGAHNVQRVVEQPELIAGVCGDCHTPTLAEWRESPHVNIGPLGCATCHAPHTQRLRAGNTPDQLCTNCHDNVPDQLVHRQHLTEDSSVTCVDCHMYRGAENSTGVTASISTIPLTTGHSMQMDTAPCTTCHEELVASGEWDQLVANRTTAAVVVEVTAEPTEEATPIPVLNTGSEANDTVTATQNTSYTQLLQGLILGLGFGVTFAAVFITRGNRTQVPVQPATEHEKIEQAPPAPEAQPPSAPEGDTDGDSQHGGT